MKAMDLSKKCYRLAIHKSYFDKGYGETSLAKYFIVLIGLDQVLKGDLRTTLLVGLAYALFCYFFGILLYKVGFVEAMHEVQNQFNAFQKEVRDKLKTKKFK